MMGLMYGHERTDKRNTGIPGDPDFKVYHDGRVLFREIKVLGGKLSEDQVKRHRELRVAGCPVGIDHSVEEFSEAVKVWLEDIKRDTSDCRPFLGHPSKPLDCVGVSNGKGKSDI